MSNISEVYLHDPWGSDHPRRESCDVFLTIFSDLYRETLAETGLMPDSDEYNPALLSDEDFEHVFQAIADKLAMNPEAVRLMDELNINFSLEALEMEELSHLIGIGQAGGESRYAMLNV